LADDLDELQRALASRYRIERELGRGGMATVYLALDVRHGRMVALKRLLPEISAAVGVARFLREIEFAARLQHPHILPVFDSGEVAGAPWYVMPHVDGRSLRDRLGAEAQLPMDEALHIAGEVAGALAYAHAHGVVHRDIKPENILLDSGHALVADFGIARAADEAGGARMTQTGMTLGTPGYMSPEQASGDRHMDGRSDLYALGCVLYEMLAGQTPYVAPTGAAMLHQHLAAPVPDVRMLRPDVPEPVARLVSRLLAKTPGDRPRDAGETLRLIESAHLALSAPAPPSVTPSRRAPIAASAIAIGAAALVVIAGLVLWRLRPVAPQIRGIAVLPLANLSGDPGQEYFADGMTEELINQLGQIGALRVISRTSAMVFKNVTLPLPQIARRLGVQAVVEGSVAHSGDRVRVTAELVQAQPEHSLWSGHFDRRLQDALALQAEVSQAIARQVAVHLTDQERARLSRPRAVDPDAHEAYLKGLFHANKLDGPNLRTAVGFFNQAIEHDPEYAQAWAGLAIANYGLSDVFMPPREAMPRARAAAGKALQLDPGLAQAHTALALVLSQYDLRWNDGEREYRRAIELDPNDSFTHISYSLLLAERGRLGPAIEQSGRAVALDPLSPYVAGYDAYNYYLAGRWEECIARYQAMLRADSSYAIPYYSIGLVRLEQGRVDEAVQYFRKAATLFEGSFPEVMTAYAYARNGRVRQARALIDTLEHDPRGILRDSDRAYLYVGLGDRDRAFDALNKAVDGRDEQVYQLRVDPRMAPLRGDPRFDRLLARLGLKT
jgi:eukaryotic-like serine/threonine-protein kinase